MYLWNCLYFLAIMVSTSLSRNDLIEFNTPPDLKNIQSNLKRQLHVLRLANVLNEDLLYFNDTDQETSDDDDSNDKYDTDDDTSSINYLSFEESTSKYSGSSWDLSTNEENVSYDGPNQISEILKSMGTKNKLQFKSYNEDLRSDIPWLSNMKKTNDTYKFFNISTAQGKLLRSRWNKSCDKKASKACKSACNQALSGMCREFRCKSNEKRSFKKDCKRNCKEKFSGGGSSSGSSRDSRSC